MEEDQLIQDLLTKSGKEFTEQDIQDIKSFYEGDTDRMIGDILTKSGAEFEEQDIADIKSFYNVKDKPIAAAITPTESAPKPVEEPRQGFLADVFDSFQAGSAHLSSMLARTPGYLLDGVHTVFAIPQNLLSNIPGLESLRTSPEQFRETLGLAGENAVAEYYDSQAEQLKARQGEQFDKGLTEYLKDGEFGKFGRSLANQVAESIPVTLGILGASMSGAGPAAITIGGGAVFGAGEMAAMQDDPDFQQLSSEQQFINSFSKGALEGLTESAVGVVPGIITMFKDVLKKEGKDVALSFAKNTFKDVYGPSFKRHLGMAGGEFIGEASNQFGANLIDKFAGNKPDLDVMENVIDAGIVGVGSSGFFSGVSAPHEMAVIRDRRNRIKQLNAEKEQLEQDLRIPAPNNVKAPIEQQRDALQDESNRILEEEKSDLDKRDNAENERILSLRNEMNDIENTLASDTELSDQAKSALNNRLEEINNELNKTFGIEETAPEEPEATTTPSPFVEDFKLQGNPVKIEATNIDTGKKEVVEMDALEAQNRIKNMLDRLQKVKDCL